MIYYAPTIFSQLGLDGNTVGDVFLSMRCPLLTHDRPPSWPPASTASSTVSARCRHCSSSTRSAGARCSCPAPLGPVFLWSLWAPSLARSGRIWSTTSPPGGRASPLSTSTILTFRIPSVSGTLGSTTRLERGLLTTQLPSAGSSRRRSSICPSAPRPSPSPRRRRGCAICKSSAIAFAVLYFILIVVVSSV